MAISPYTAREQARWMRPNASLWVRPDAARFLKPGTRVEDVYPALALKYNPNQPRVPSGNPDGGRWTDGEGGAGQLAQPMGRIGITDRRVISDADPESVKPGAQYAQIDRSILGPDGLPYYDDLGHHEMARAIYEKWDLSPETRRVFDGSTTGKLPGNKLIDGPVGTFRGNIWDGPKGAHAEYNRAVEELSERFMRERGITPRTMTPDQARDLLAEIRKTDDPRISDFNRGIRMLRRIFRLNRGRE